MRLLNLTAFLFLLSFPLQASMPTSSHFSEQYQLRSPLSGTTDGILLAEGNVEGNTDSDDTDEDFITPKQKAKVKSFWKKYFALQPNNNLVKEVRENKWVFFVGGCMSCVGGTVWIPNLVIDEEPPPGYFQESFINWGSHFVFQGVNNVITVALASVNLPSPTALLACADMFWWLPVNAMNVWDDARKRSIAQAQIQEEFVGRLMAQKQPPETTMKY